MFKRAVIADLPSRSVMLQALRLYAASQGVDRLHVTLIVAEGGYKLRAHIGYQPRETFELVAEKSGQVRLFKSVESAFNVCRDLGFSVVAVEI